MEVKALVSGCDLTEGKIYDVIFEYDTVYELKCDTGTYCRPKSFFISIHTSPEGSDSNYTQKNSHNHLSIYPYSL